MSTRKRVFGIPNGIIILTNCEAIAEEAPCKVSRLGVNDQYGHSGPGAKLLEEYGFTAENIAARAKEMLK